MATKQKQSVLSTVLAQHEKSILQDWLKLQAEEGALESGQIQRAELQEQSTQFLDSFRRACQSGNVSDIGGPDWEATRQLLSDISRSRVVQGFTPSQTAMFVFSMKQPIFDALRRECGRDAERLAEEVWSATVVLDKLGLYTTELFQKSREEVIARQQEEMLELSTPVVQLWQGVLALPLIGTLDSARTQVVMENMLQRIVDSEAEIAIIDITGVPTVDTLVAQHLIKTVQAARLMGADCIISGIRPQIAQTIVHLGLELDVVSKATMADALALALRRIGKAVVNRTNSAGEKQA
jgi:rsbT co-antagonist protein RsbR